jgi:serine/threonine-protein kinase RsbW
MIETLGRAGLMSSEKEMEWRLCFDEALVNAIVHGNQRDPRRLVVVSLMISDRAWGVRIEDEGKGFSPASVPDPDAQESLLLEHGRGILLMKSLLDEIHYYAGGSKVLLVKRLSPACTRRSAKRPAKAKAAARGRHRGRPTDSKEGL